MLLVEYPFFCFSDLQLQLLRILQSPLVPVSQCKISRNFQGMRMLLTEYPLERRYDLHLQLLGIILSPLARVC